MGFIDDKRDIFNQIGALTSVNDSQNIPNPKNSISSINNSKEIVPFLLDLLVVLVGSEILKSVMGELMTGFIRNVEPTLKQELKNQIIEYNSNQTLPSSFVNNGISVAATDIDSYEKFKTDPSSQTGNFLYNTTTPNFDKTSYDATQSAGSEITYNNSIIKYDDISNSFNYKPTNSSQTIGEYLNDYIDNLVLIDEKEFTSNVINTIFGTINSNQNKTEKQLIFEEKLNTSINKLINEYDDISISDNELRQIEITSKNRKNGVSSVDVGCAIIDNTVTIDSLQDLVNITLSSTNPLEVGNAYSNLIGGGFNSSNQNQATENSEAIKDGFFKRLINAIVTVLISAILTPPQIRALFAIGSSFKNNGIPNIGNPIDDLINRRKLADCLSKKAKSIINEFLFNIVKTQMLNIIIPVSKIILKEKINQYLGILRSLIGFK